MFFMKKLTLALALILLLSGSAMAQEFNKFSMDIAAGWTCVEDGSVLIVAPNKEAAVSIAFNTVEGVTAEATACEFSKKEVYKTAKASCRTQSRMPSVSNHSSHSSSSPASFIFHISLNASVYVRTLRVSLHGI